jgi:hypothetical protein
VDFLALPPEAGIGTAHWAVDFQPVEVAGKTLTLLTMLTQAVYRVTRAGMGNRAEWNVTTFAKYERYGSSATLSSEST